MLKPITVGELIKLLETFPQDAIVESDGCDCIGDACTAKYYESDHTVLIIRTENVLNYISEEA